MSFHWFFFLISASTALSFTSFFAEAQTVSGTDSLKLIVLSEVTVTEKTTIPINTVQRMGYEELIRRQSNTLGETLSHLPGVQNTYFGPQSGAPMIRSMSGNRVKVLSNGVALNDLSGISPNLNIITDMDNLLGIEVYKSGASILYGGKAVGGAVNLRDNTIPNAQFQKKASGFASAEATSNNGYKQAFDLNGDLGKKWTWHIGGMNRWNKDIRIPGNTKAPIAYDPKIDELTATMAQVNVDKQIVRNLSLYPYISQFVLTNMNNPAWGLSEADLYTFQATSVIDGKTIPNPANNQYVPGQDPKTPLSTTLVKGIDDYAPVTRGIMPNSHAEVRSWNAGTSYLGKKFYTGIGYRGHDGNYGIPAFALRKLPEHTHTHDDGYVHTVPGGMTYLPINTQSRSNSFLSETGLRSPARGINSLKLNYMLQMSDDRELVGDFNANQFNTQRHVVRAEVTQTPVRFIKGLSGIDFSSVKISGSGQQRYLPDNRSLDYGIFTLQQLQFNPVQIDLGYRYDKAQRSAQTGGGYRPSRGLAGGKLTPREFSLHHFNTGLQVKVTRFGFLKASFIHAERAPDVNELYAGNNHYAIMIEENGDDRLNREISRTVDLGAGISYKGLRLAVSRYRNNFSNYLYLAHTGIARSGGFLVKEWRQSDTQISGWETELTYKAELGHYAVWELSSYFDLVKNKNTSDDRLRQWAEGDYMPNLPTSRYGLSSLVQIQKVEFSALLDRYLQQRYLGKNINPEPPMPAYSLLSARVSYQSSFKGVALQYYISGNNLLDVEARPQNSFLKYLAPLPGRNIAIGLKVGI